MPLIDRAHACPICGAPYGWLVCTECWKLELSLAETRCTGLLEPPLSRCITMYKDGGERRMAGPLGELLADTADDLLGWATHVVAVPASRRAVRRRGFDHARELAQSAASALRSPVAEILTPTGSVDQRRLGREDRFANAHERFACRRRFTERAYVLLIDDVLTTGATVDSAARALLEAGAREVRACVLARTW